MLRNTGLKILVDVSSPQCELSLAPHEPSSCNLRCNCHPLRLKDGGLHYCTCKLGSMGNNLRLKILWFAVAFAISST